MKYFYLEYIYIKKKDLPLLWNITFSLKITINQTALFLCIKRSWIPEAKPSLTRPSKIVRRSGSGDRGIGGLVTYQDPQVLGPQVLRSSSLHSSWWPPFSPRRPDGSDILPQKGWSEGRGLFADSGCFLPSWSQFCWSQLLRKVKSCEC